MVKTNYTGRYRLSSREIVVKKWFKTTVSTAIVLEIEKRDYGYTEHFDSTGGPGLKTDIDNTYWVNATLEDVQELDLLQLLTIRDLEL